MKNTTNPELPLEDYYDEALALMRQVLDNVCIRASRANNQNMRIGGILAPEHFTVEMRRLVFWSWNAMNDGIIVQPVRPVSHSATVYPKNDCVDRLYNPALPWDQGEWVLVIHQDFDYLSLSLSWVTTNVYDTMSQNIAMPISTDDIVSFLRSADDYMDHSKITSIVLSSHDGNTDFRVVQEALDKVDARLWNQRKTSSLELKYVAAAGAACLARQIAVFPVEDNECELRHPDPEETIPPHLRVEL